MAFNKSDIKYGENFIVENTQKVNLDKFDNLNELFDFTFYKNAEKYAFINMHKRLKFKHIDMYSRRFAAYLLNHTDLEPGDKVILQMPNILTYPIAAIGILRAGMVIVNTNPLYTEREMEHQFNDSKAKAIVAFVGAAQKIEHILPNTKIKHVILTNVADMHSTYKRRIINWAVKYISKTVPKYKLPYAVSFRKTLKLGKKEDIQLPNCKRSDTACLQYTGGTTGVAKGAVLSHGNLIANILQIENIIDGVFDGIDNPLFVAPLPLYHIYSFNTSFLTPMYCGIGCMFITDPRDINGFIRSITKIKFHGLVGINTLFNVLSQKEKFKNLDLSDLRLSLSGGMPSSENVANNWKDITGLNIIEGYGMSETSPLTLANPIGQTKVASIGYPIANTAVKIVDDEGKTLEFGQSGELCVKGPQVMQGYWENTEETAKVMDADGFLRTGDVAIIDEEKRFKIVDRKKDVINVSGFNVYPNEVEEVLSLHPCIMETAVIGIKDEKSGEAVKAYIVKNKERNVEVKELKKWCEQRLAAYKRPRVYEFREELPKSAVGKILRKDLRD